MESEGEEILVIKNQNELFMSANKIKEAWEEGKPIIARDKSIFTLYASPFNRKAVESTIELTLKQSEKKYYLYPYIISDEKFVEKFVYIAYPSERFFLNLTKTENLIMLAKAFFNFHPKLLLNGKIGVKLADENNKLIKIIGGITLAFPYIKNGTPVFHSSQIEIGDIIVDISPELSSFKPPSYIEITEGYVVKFIFEGEISRYDFKNKFEVFGLKVI
ncbi:hypothetical protein HRbin19_01000 [bacterium HR19]|nr:hypothetical protein HRbin19_01000 [bacterium HR19]